MWFLCVDFYSRNQHQAKHKSIFLDNSMCVVYQLKHKLNSYKMTVKFICKIQIVESYQLVWHYIWTVCSDLKHYSRLRLFSALSAHCVCVCSSFCVSTFTQHKWKTAECKQIVVHMANIIYTKCEENRFILILRYYKMYLVVYLSLVQCLLSSASKFMFISLVSLALIALQCECVCVCVWKKSHCIWCWSDCLLNCHDLVWDR